jgi:hypothetical protein
MGCLWEGLAGTLLDGRFHLRSLTSAGADDAEFRADNATVTFVCPPPAQLESTRARMREAAALRHPNLLAILGAGEVTVGGRTALYLAGEPAECSLAGARLGDADARRLILDLSAALSYLEGRGLVCRSLEPHTVVRAGGCWKLADYGRMEPGERGPEGMRALAALLAEVAPRHQPFVEITAHCTELEDALVLLEAWQPRRSAWPRRAAIATVAAAVTVLALWLGTPAPPPEPPVKAVVAEPRPRTPGERRPSPMPQIRRTAAQSEQ